MGYLRHNERVEILGTSGNYYRIPFQGSTGYVLKRYIVLETSATTTTAATIGASSGGSRTKGLIEIRTTISEPKTTTYTAKPFESIADVARKLYNSNTNVKNIVDANKKALTNVANGAKKVLGTLTSGLKLIIPNATKTPAGTTNKKNVKLGR